jgi:hypothetical protein
MLFMHRLTIVLDRYAFKDKADVTVLPDYGDAQLERDQGDFFNF